MAKSDPSETAPLLAPPVVDPEAAAPPPLTGNGSQNGQVDGVKELGNRIYVLLPAVAIGLLLSAVDQLITLASYTKMGNDLNALNSVSWIATSYFLTLTSCQPLYGKLSDIFGRKECLLFAYAVFGLGCLGCGLAQSMVQLCVARGVAGVGGGGMTAVVSILVSDIVPLRERGVWQGYINIIFAAGTATGAPLGGILADSIGWRWSFIGQTPLCVIAALVVYFALDLAPPTTDHLWSKIKRIDFLGALTLVTAVFALLFGLDAGSKVGWTHLSTILALGVAAPLSLGVFLYVEARVASHPFAPGRIIFERSMFACYMTNFFSMAGQMGAFFFLPLYFQAVHGFSATVSGALLVPGMVGGVGASIAGGWVIKRTGRFYWITVWGFGLLFAALPVIAAGLWMRNVALEEIGYVICCIGAYSGVTTSLIGLLANATVEDTAVVVACSYLFRSLGSSIGISICSAVLQQVLRGELDRRLVGDDAREIEKRVRQNLDYIRELTPEVAEMVRTSYQTAELASIAPAVGFTAVAFLFAFWVRETAIRK
ncbi:uncharacterized protein LMH87_008538 [Akanthomyces muscarius]|uniref:Major facilitator superfamily (MFS) profile domain-containing protein n=1 Tax=Akanthomyces muscarius TaxID=2231603 RepID=A0A9W8QHG3_AKAMU|nr:uncharacterized protein LMH87_008538 [Akanthomyces muscarius]KAJ4157991.1 hypothetical protein LMH87_008538 [Akanthomyces muscarius]